MMVKLDDLTSTNKGALTVVTESNPIATLSNRVSQINVHTRLRNSEDIWPPQQPKNYTPLVLIHQQIQHNLKQANVISEFVERGHIDQVFSVTNDDSLCCKSKKHYTLQKALDNSMATKEVADILNLVEAAKEPQFVLIEGAPGIGKSLLLKEIAYRWGKQELLGRFKLVLLLCLHDPAVQQMSLVNHLFQPFCKRDSRATEIISACSGYFLINNRCDLMLLLDGYDEYPEPLQKDSLIADILKREVLPHCGLIVSSRPHASASLRKQATIKVDVLGFTESERKHYIKDAMEDQVQKIDELMEYLLHHSTINSLCYVPFNMVILVHLFQQGIPLPKNSAELYRYFICLTICRHLSKGGHYLTNNITTLTDLPEPYNKIVHQLSKLSLEALNKNQLIFTLNEIKVACNCPDLTTVPEAITGFGLLQTVKHFGITGPTMKFNFLHLSIQEYLAADYLANLPVHEELKVIKSKFWSPIHLNMFSIYISLTKGQRPAFKNFISNGDKTMVISPKFLRGQMKCFHLYCCFHEAGDTDVCKTIAQSESFSHKEINTRSIKLTPCDMECIAVFLISPFHNLKEWVKLDMQHCSIQDHGLHTLLRGLYNCNDIVIKELQLGYNGLTKQSSFLLSEITLRFNVRKLRIDGNHTIGEDQKLYSILTSPFTMLKTLNMDNAKLSSNAAISLFTALKDNDKLKEISIGYNDIRDDACDVITTTIERNSCLSEMIMWGNPISSITTQSILIALKKNSTLTLLGLPFCPDDIMKINNSIQEDINTMRENQHQVKLNVYYL